MSSLDRDGRIEPRELESEMRSSYLDYAMSVIVGRALPDVRDGLKPVHRRVLFTMNDMGLAPERGYVKSANTVGRVMGEFHPHGDQSIYDALVRLAQPFATRYPLVDGQGNFGSTEFPAAAMRYTEARMSRYAVEMLRGIDEDTVDMTPTYDDRRMEPTVLPSRVPNLLVNGSSGIAVGMATNIPPHNIGEVVDAVVAMIDNPAITVEQLMTHLHGPDFPTGGVILGRQGIVDAYRTGRGRVVVRGRAHNEQLRNGRNAIIFTELPYQVNKAELVSKIAHLANDGVLKEVADANDESGRDGTRVVITLRRGAVPLVVLNKIFKHTAAQSTFGVNAIALVNGVPRTLGVREMLMHYLEHQREVVVRRSRFRLARAEARAHILEGLLIALENIDAVIALIRGAADPEEARNGLMSRFGLSEVQARAILDLRLQRLTQLESHQIRDEHAQITKEIAALRAILGDEARVMAVIREEILALREKFVDGRRTEIVAAEGEIDLEDLIAEEEMVISLSAGGYLKRLPVTTYRAQRRGGKGLRGTKLKDDDHVEHLFIASTHTYLLFFTNQGRVYRQKVHELPQGGRDSRGRHISNVLALLEDEEVRAVFATRDYREGTYLVLATRHGMVKKTEFTAYDTVLREKGLAAITLADDDELVGVQLTDGADDLLIVSARGQAARFSEQKVKPQGRQTRGVKAMNLDDGDRVLALCVARDDEDLMVVTGNGYGKRTPMSDYPSKGRPTKGVRTIRVSDRKGELVTARPVREGNQLLLVSAMGQVIRIEVSAVKKMGRSTEGVRLMDMRDDDQVVSVASVVEENDPDADGDDVAVATDQLSLGDDVDEHSDAPDPTRGEVAEDLGADDDANNGGGDDPQ